MFWSVWKMKLDGRCIISCKEKILNPSLHKQFMTISYFLSVCLPLQVGPQQVQQIAVFCFHDGCLLFYALSQRET